MLWGLRGDPITADRPIWGPPLEMIDINNEIKYYVLCYCIMKSFNYFYFFSATDFESDQVETAVGCHRQNSTLYETAGREHCDRFKLSGPTPAIV